MNSKWNPCAFQAVCQIYSDLGDPAICAPYVSPDEQYQQYILTQLTFMFDSLP